MLKYQQVYSTEAAQEAVPLSVLSLLFLTQRTCSSSLARHNGEADPALL